jgi:hypothetical protein
LENVNFDEEKIEKNKRILFISYYLPPLGGPYSIRLVNFINYLDKSGWNVDVLTILPHENFPLYENNSVKNYSESLNIFRTSNGFINKIFYSLIKNANYKLKHGHSSNIKNNGRELQNYFLKMFKHIANSLLIPDSTIEWFPFGIYKGLKLSKKNNYDLLISSSFPATCHFIAYVIKKKREIPWIVDYGDPWVFNPFFTPKRIKFPIEYKIESSILKTADAIIVTADETKENYLRNYPELNRFKINVIPMGAENKLFQNVNIDRSKKFRILYTGTVYAGTKYGSKNLEPFLDAVEKIYNEEKFKKDIEIIFIGNVLDDAFEVIRNKNLDKKIILKGHLPHEKIPSSLINSDILLLFGGEGEIQIASKIFEYIAARRPILCVKGGEKDPTLKILQESNRGIIVDNKTEKIYLEIIRLYNLYQKQKLESSFDLSEKLEYSWENRARELYKICCEIA